MNCIKNTCIFKPTNKEEITKKLFWRRPWRENPRTLVLVLHRHGLWDGPDHVLCWGEKLHRKTWRSSKFELLHVQQHGSSNDDQVDCPSINCLNLQQFQILQNRPLLLWQQTHDWDDGRHQCLEQVLFNSGTPTLIYYISATPNQIESQSKFNQSQNLSNIRTPGLSDW